ncbi:MAG: PilW family protein [Gammaproteobacteria bacterium]|nr:PilW family protein [Gammaproteobacteria bacterium]
MIQSLKRNQNGVTLIELMIALSLGIIVTFMTIKVYVDHRQAFRLIDATNRLQENGRLAIEFLSINIREAAYNCTNTTSSTCLTGVNSTTDSITFDDVDSDTKKFLISNGENGKSLFFDDGDSTNGTGTEEYVEGIENMQILYGEDTDNDKIPNYYVPYGTSGLSLDNVVSVRISLLAQSVETGVSSSVQTVEYDNDDDGIKETESASNGRLLKVFNTTIQIRNRVLN